MMIALMELDAAHVAEQLRFLRKCQKLTQENVADLCGLTARTIEKLESGRHRPAEQTLASLCRGLRIEESYFFKPSPAELARQQADFKRALRKTARVETSPVRTAHQVMDLCDGCHAWNMDMAEVAESALTDAADLIQLVFDWGEIWSDLSFRDRLDAAREIVGHCDALGQAGYLVHVGRMRLLQRFAQGEPLMLNVGLVSVRPAEASASQRLALVQLDGPWEVPS